MAGISQARRDDSTSAGLACDDLAAGTAKAVCRIMVEGFRVLAEFNSWAKRWNGRVHKRRSHLGLNLVPTRIFNFESK